VDSGYLKIARGLLAVAAISAFLDLQPLSIHWVAEEYAALESKSIPPSLLGILAGTATAISLFAQKLGAFLETTRLSPKTSVQMLRILTRIALVCTGLVLPVLLLIAYWYLTACLYDEPKVPKLVTPAMADRLDLTMLIGFGVIVLLFEANAYSLHQFYKDRLSKAFLFKPADSSPSEPPALLNFKLSKINPNTGPYHILNAALKCRDRKKPTGAGAMPIFSPSRATSSAATLRILHQQRHMSTRLEWSISIRGLTSAPPWQSPARRFRPIWDPTR
jgi:hypothetical protein